MKRSKTMIRMVTALAVLVLCFHCLVPGSLAVGGGQEAPDTSKNTTGKTTKNETVYVFADAEGGVRNIVVSDELQNPTGLTTLDDVSTLGDIKNVDGDETFESGEGDALVWQAGGKDISYQGNSSANPPVTMDVSYKLDGQAISPEALAGASGRVTIRYDYTNHSRQTVNGASLYTPFVAITGVVLDSESFTNIEVSNGKVINDGDRTIVAGFALPGMQENLGVGGDIMDIPGYVEITADVTDFQLDATATVVTAGLFDDVDASRFSAGDISGAVGQLTGAMGQLLDGSSALYDGVAQLAEGTQVLATGTAELEKQTSPLPAQADRLAVGTDELSKGLDAAVDAADKLESGSNSLVSGTQQLVALLGDESTEGTIIHGSSMVTQALEAGDANLSSAVAEMASGSSSAKAAANEAVADANTASSKAEAAAASAQEAASLLGANASGNDASSEIASAESALAAISTEGMTEEQIASIKAARAAMSAAKAAAGGTNDNSEAKQAALAAVESANAAATAADGAAASAKEAVQDIGSVSNGIEEVSSTQSMLEKAGQVSSSVTNGAETVHDQMNDSIVSGLKGLASGLGKLKGDDGSGLTAASDGAKQLKAGTARLADAAPQLVEGIKAINTGAQQLASGQQVVKDGTMQLSQGLQQFDQQGIQKLADALGGIDNVVSRLSDVVEAGRRYDNFSGKSSKMDGTVKFVIETDAIA